MSANQEKPTGPLAWMRGFCTSLNPSIETPLTVTFEGAPHTAATNGQIMLLVPGDHGYPAPGGIDFAKAFASLPKIAPREVPLAALRDFLKVESAAEGVCATCEGAGKLECEECDGEGAIECSCSKCGDDHDSDCGECEGTGTVRCSECGLGNEKTERVVLERVVLGGGIFNRNLLAPAVRRLTGETVTWAYDGGPRPALLRAEGMAIIVMSLRADDDRAFKDVPRFAPLDIPVAA